MVAHACDLRTERLSQPHFKRKRSLGDWARMRLRNKNIERTKHVSQCEGLGLNTIKKGEEKRIGGCGRGVEGGGGSGAGGEKR